MGATTKAKAKAPAASKVKAPEVTQDVTNPPADDATLNAPPADPVIENKGDKETQPDPVEKAEKPKGKSKLTFPLIALIKKFDDRIPTQVADEEGLDKLIDIHGAENVEVQG